jgi:hypothetical protein
MSDTFHHHKDEKAQAKARRRTSSSRILRARQHEEQVRFDLFRQQDTERRLSW